MPDGKPAGVRCIHLTEDYRCAIYDRRPKVCRDFQAEELVCGQSRENAIKILSDLDTEAGSRKSEVRYPKSAAKI